MEIRINRYVAERLPCSRRNADELVEAGRVTLNGVAAQPGSRVGETDVVAVDGKVIEQLPSKIYILYHKPVGVICTSDPAAPDNIIERVKHPSRVFYVGRLDVESSGVVLLTNDGDIVNRISRARFGHEKEYVVQVDRPYTPELLEKLADGVDIGDEFPTLPAQVWAENATIFRVVLTEGRNRQVRRMCEALGYEVTDLKRVRLMHLTVDGLASDTWRDLTRAEISELMARLDVDYPQTTPPRPPAHPHLPKLKPRVEEGSRPSVPTERAAPVVAQAPRQEEPTRPRSPAEGEETRAELAPPRRPPRFQNSGGEPPRPPRRVDPVGDAAPPARPRFEGHHGEGDDRPGPARHFDQNRGQGDDRPRPPRRFEQDRSIGEDGPRPPRHVDARPEAGPRPPRGFDNRDEERARPPRRFDTRGDEGPRPPRRFEGDRPQGDDRPRPPRRFEPAGDDGPRPPRRMEPDAYPRDVRPDRREEERQNDNPRPPRRFDPHEFMGDYDAGPPRRRNNRDGGPRPSRPQFDGPRQENPRPPRRFDSDAARGEDGPRGHRRDDGPRGPRPQFYDHNDERPRPPRPQFDNRGEDRPRREDGPRPSRPQFDNREEDRPRREEGPRPPRPQFDNNRDDRPRREDGPRPSRPQFDNRGEDRPRREDGPRPPRPQFDHNRDDRPRREDGPRPPRPQFDNRGDQRHQPPRPSYDRPSDEGTRPSRRSEPSSGGENPRAPRGGFRNDQWSPTSQSGRTGDRGPRPAAGDRPLRRPQFAPEPKNSPVTDREIQRLLDAGVDLEDAHQILREKNAKKRRT